MEGTTCQPLNSCTSAGSNSASSISSTPVVTSSTSQSSSSGSSQSSSPSSTPASSSTSSIAQTISTTTTTTSTAAIAPTTTSRPSASVTRNKDTAHRTAIIASTSTAAVLLLLLLLLLCLFFRRRRQHKRSHGQHSRSHFLAGNDPSDYCSRTISASTHGGSTAMSPYLLHARGKEDGSIFREDVWPPPSASSGTVGRGWPVEVVVTVEGPSREELDASEVAGDPRVGSWAALPGEADLGEFACPSSVREGEREELVIGQAL